MATYDKVTKFFYLQLKEDFFEEDTIEWLEEQENGEKYVLFYLKLCLKSLKSNGIFIKSIGNRLIPYDAKALAKLTHTDVDTVKVAMNLLVEIGLIQVLEQGELYISQLEHMIGSKSLGALKKQQQRQLKKERQKELPLPEEVNETSDGQEVDICPPNINIKLNIKDKDININKNIKEIKEENIKEEKKSLSKKFVKPSLEEVEEYCSIKNLKVDAEHFIDYYESVGWIVGKNPMKDWKATLRNWDRRSKKGNNAAPVRKEIVPDWINKEIQKEELSEEELEELKSDFDVFNQDSDFLKRKAALEEKLRSKYSKKGNNTND